MFDLSLTAGFLVAVILVLYIVRAGLFLRVMKDALFTLNVNMVGKGVVMAFDDRTEDFCYGFECGCIWERMRHVVEIDDCFHLCNQVQILKMAEVAKWTVHFYRDLDNGWFRIHMTDASVDAPESDVLPFSPPTDDFDPPREWSPEVEDE